MLEFTRYYGRKRVRGAVVLTVGLSLFTTLYVSLFPSLTTAIDLDAYVEAMPPALREAFGIQSLASIEGFLATELYSFGWVLLLGLYLAYSAASQIAGDVESGRMDMLLALPTSRARLLVEKFSALLVPILVANTVVPVVVYAGVIWIGESISVADLLVVHAASIPYLLTTAGIGLLASVVFDRAGIAQRVGAGAVFGLFLVESVVAGTDFEVLGVLSPTRYYDPTAILVESDWDPAGAVVLCGMAAVLLTASTVYFRRKDIS
jgi:ABC-2 type transport system permease protein